MSNIVDMNGVPIIEIDGTPWKQTLLFFEKFHRELSKKMSHDDILSIETSVGTIEFYFK